MRDRYPPSLLALGPRPFPPSVTIDGRVYRLKRPFKHDFFAATALYEGNGTRIVLKIGREAHFFGIPLQWLGRLLARREARLYQRLADLRAVPRFAGMWGDHAMAHEYIEGHPLRQGERVADDYFDRLRDALKAVHARGMAYVDLEKCENVLVGDDGQPYLLDFQIAWYVAPRHGGALAPARWLLRRLQQADLYHLRKLQRRTRPDQLSEAERAESYRRPAYIRLHRWLTGPAQAIRRAILNRFDPSRRHRERGRLDMETAAAQDSSKPRSRRSADVH